MFVCDYNIPIHFYNNYIFSYNYIKTMDIFLLETIYKKKKKKDNKIFNKLLRISYIKSYLLNRYSDSDTSLEKNLLRIYRNIEFLPRCTVCGKPVVFTGKHGSAEFTKHCTWKCAANDKITVKKKKETQLKNWGTTGCYDSSIYKEKLFKEHGIYSWSDLEVSKERRKNALLNKYGTTNMYSVPEIREKITKTCIERYGLASPTGNINVQKRKNLTTKLNNSYKKSKGENKVLQLLLNNFNNIETQYSSDLYNYSCDFYLSDFDVYIEYHGSHYHHYEPFDINNQKHLIELNKLKDKSIQLYEKRNRKNQYDSIIYTWTDLDVRKLNEAKNNKLKYICLYKIPSEDELVEIVKTCNGIIIYK